MHDLCFYKSLTFIAVGSLISSTLTIIFIISKFCIYIKNRKKYVKDLKQYRERRDNFESFRLGNSLINYWEDDQIDTSHTYSPYF
jgi:hypothetical protein